ncbi:Thermostable beta-glucosidase B [termite gut metagenome]|uniref:Thermostable beta-glucosidase B n=1 Tax=termite gut metagenome TaxID=433724 RepID=A0A5J4R6C7_9ZZZZ
MVMTDWFGGKTPALQMYAGNDLLMPGSDKQYQDIVAAVKEGSLSIENLDINVRRVLNLIVQSPRFKGYKYSNTPDLKAHAAITRQSAAEGMILLKNNNDALPFSAKVKTVAAFGVTSYDFIAGGTGSGDVNKAYTVSLVEGLNNAGYKLNADLQQLYEKHIRDENEKNKPDPNNPFATFMPKIRPGELTPEAVVLKAQATATDVALITIGRTSGEFMDRKIPDDFELTKHEKQLIDEVCKAFHAVGKKVVVILNIGGVIETASWKELPDAILLAGQAGQEGGNTVADALSGKINPSGKLASTYPVKYEDIASSSNFPFDYKSDNQFMMGGGVSKEKKDFVRNVDYTNYEEGIYVGYRYFDTFDKAVSYPFGFGLSYTAFNYLNPKIIETEGVYTVTVDVKNTGKVAGKEIVQLYVSAPVNAQLPKPAKELKAFAKTKELKPGESETISMKVNSSELASFHENVSAWVIDSGAYRVLIGTSSKDIKASLSIHIEQGAETKANDVLRLQEPVNALKK